MAGLSRSCSIVLKSIETAHEVIRIMVGRLYPTGNLRFAMEAHFLYVSFAAAFLVNVSSNCSFSVADALMTRQLLRPKFSLLLDQNQREKIIRDVSGLIDVLSSKDVALDERHTPALYSRFLSSLLAKHTLGRYCPDKTSQHNLNDQCKNINGHSSAFPAQYSWPDVPLVTMGEQFQIESKLDRDQATSINGEFDMDLSFSHFVRTISQDLPRTQTNLFAGENVRDWRFDAGRLFNSSFEPW